MKQLILILIILTAGYVCHAQLRPPAKIAAGGHVK